MANLRSAMDATFWDFNVASPRNFDGVARAVPGQPIPLDGARASRAIRVQQLSFLANGFPLGIIPSYCPPTSSDKDLGSFSLQSAFLKQEIGDCWLSLIGQFRPKKLISSIRAELSACDEWEFPALKDVARHFLNKSLYSLGFCSQFSPSPETSLLFNVEGHGERKGYRTKAVLFHKLPFHDITLEAAGPELFIDHHNQYWEVPLSISLDMSSLVSKSGLQYHFGMHKNSGDPQAINATNSKVPSALMPGIFAKAAFSYEKSKDLWRKKETEEDILVKTDKGKSYWTSYDVCLREPHAAISGIIGGTCAAWFGNGLAVEKITFGDKRTNSLDADLFGSLCCNFQHGKFRKLYGDLTRVDARLDITSALGLAKRVSNVFRNSTVSEANTLSSPRLNLIFQQQVVGPILFRVDSKMLLDSSSESRGPRIEDFICSVSYSLRLLQSGKVVAWYSPKRKEGMVELRLFEF